MSGGGVISGDSSRPSSGQLGRPEDVSDEELLRRARAAPEQPEGKGAASDLLARYRSKVYLWCYRYVREHERALDLAQEVLLNAYRSLDSFGGRAKFSSWLFVITRNCCLSAMRSPGLLADPAVEADTLIAPGDAPDRMLESKEDEESILRLLREVLDPMEQEAIWLRCFEKMPVDEITSLLGITASSGARGVLQTARRKLRAALERRG